MQVGAEIHPLEEVKRASRRDFHGSYQISYRVRAVIVCAIVAALSFLARNFHLDDALIYARYISHALNGIGLQFNANEPINALTSIFDTWLVLGFAWMLRGDVLLAQAVLSCLFLVAAALLAERMVPLAGMLLASMSLFYYCVGMETSLFVLMLMITIHAYANDRINWLPFLCLLTALTRFEGAALIPIIALQLAMRRRFPSAKSYIPAALLISFYLGFNLYFYHALLPQSATAKLGQGFSGYWGRWPTAFLRLPDIFFRPFGKSYALMFGFLIFAAFGVTTEKMKRWNRLLIPFFLILGMFYVLFNIPNYYWYYAPFLFFGIIYAASVIPQARASQWAGFAFALCLALSAAKDLKKNGNEDASYSKMAHWIDENTPQDARIAAVETGTIGWYSNRYLIDIVGLTTPQNARYTAHRDFSSWITEKPDYVVVHPTDPFPWEKVALNNPEYHLMPIHFDKVYLLRRKKSQ